MLLFLKPFYGDFPKSTFFETFEDVELYIILKIKIQISAILKLCNFLIQECYLSSGIFLYNNLSVLCLGTLSQDLNFEILIL